MKQNKLIQSSLILASCFLLLASPSVAQYTTGLSAMPPRLEITVAPGKLVTKEIKVRNESNVVKLVTTSSSDFIVTDDKGTPIQISENNLDQNRWAASSWIQVSPSKLQIKPGETKSIVVSVLVPVDALPGGHYAMILHTPNNEAIINQTGASVQANVGTLVYVTVPGDIKQDAFVKIFSAPNFSEYGPINFSTTVSNLSDIHIAPFGSITVKNWLGGKTAQLPLISTNIFPYTSRDFTNTLTNKWLFGRYTATFNANYGTANQVLLASLVFWVIPWKLILLLIVAAILIGVIIYLIKTRPPSQKETITQVEELEKELSTLKKKYQDRK